MKILLLVVFTFLGFGLYGQSPKLYFEYEKSLELNISADNLLTAAFHDSGYYYCCYMFDPHKIDSNNNTVAHTLYTLNTTSGSIDSFTFAVPYSEIILRWGVSALAISDKYIGIKADKIYVFDKATHQLLNTIPHFHCHNVYFLDGTKVLLTKNYDSHPHDDSIRTKFMVIDFNSGKIEKMVTPDFRYIIYTHFVSNFVDVSENKIAFAQAIPYSISFYDVKTLEKINSINSNKLENTDNNIYLIDSLHESMKTDFNAKGFFYALKQVDTGVNRIEKIFLLSEDTLLVSRYFAGSKFDKRKLDVWTLDKMTNSWNNIIYDQLYQTYYPPSYDYTITKESFPANLTYSDKLIHHDKSLLILSTKVPPKMGIQNSQRKAFEDNFYETHDLNYYLMIYKWDIR